MAAPKLAQGKTGRHYIWPPSPADPQLVVPSVTTILNEANKPALVNWAAKSVATYAAENLDQWSGLDTAEAIDLLKRAPWRHTTSAANRGSAAHDAIEAHIRNGHGQPVDVDIELLPYVAAALQFLDDFNVDPIHIEGTVFNRTYQYAGSADLFANVTIGEDTVVAVVDWKTGSGIYPETALQLAAYAHGEFIGTADGQEHPMPHCDLGLAVHLKDDATYEAWPTQVQEPRHFKTFIALRTLHHFSSNVKPNVWGKRLKGSATTVAV